MTNSDNINITSRDQSWQRIYNFYRRHPVIYIAAVFTSALAGFLFLMLFPALMIMGVYKLLYLLEQSALQNNNILLSLWGIVTLLATIITGNLITMRIPQVQGVNIEFPTANNLYDLLIQISRRIKIPKIDNIIITEQLTIDIIKTPSLPLPLTTRNTLIIGLPLLQCLSPEYFRCAVTRKLLLHSKHRHFFMKWLYQMRQCWMQYLNTFLTTRRFSNLPLTGFFAFYAPFYRDLATPVAYREELEVDTEILELVDDEDLLQTMESILVTKIYLDRQYWPTINQMLKNNSKDGLRPYSKLEEVLKKALTTTTTKRWLDAIYRYDTNRISAIPDLKPRMDNIGRNKIRIPEKINQSAAHHFLGSDYPQVVAAINRLWVQKHRQINTTDDNKNHIPVITQPPIDGTHLVLPSTLHADIFK